MLRAFTVAAAVASAFAAPHAAPSNQTDKITSLPGFPGGKTPFDMYSGYLEVNATTGKNLFYWFAESQGDPAQDPLVVWFQGGPGCSSLIGFMMENGPLTPTADGGVALNPFAWNTFANTLYIDAPAGVGFSYSKTPSDYNTDNNDTANSNYIALQLWLARFPAFAGNPTYISGESYAGDYVPQVVYKILTGSATLIQSQLKGFVIGNPVFSCQAWKEQGNNIQIELFYWHGMISFSSYRYWGATCKQNPNSNDCNALLNTIQDSIGVFDPDDLYTNFFTGNASLGVGATPNISIQQLIPNYLNQPAVQAAIHAVPTNWTACCSEAGQSGATCALNYTNNWDDMLPYYQFFKSAWPEGRILIYSGDVDVATCPFAYAQLCISELAWPILQPWAPWNVSQQTAGFSEVYDGLTYATVKGAGHEVPLFQPQEALYLVSNFIAGTFP